MYCRLSFARVPRSSPCLNIKKLSWRACKIESDQQSISLLNRAVPVPPLLGSSDHISLITTKKIHLCRPIDPHIGSPATADEIRMESNGSEAQGEEYELTMPRHGIK